MASKLSLAQRAKKDPKLRKRALANPGLRSKLPASMLPTAMRQQREMNARLKQPITPGSAITERDLARESKSAMDVKYGPLEAAQKQGLAEEQTRGRDVAGFYDQYLRQIAAHSANVQAIGQQATNAGLGVQSGITGLANTDLSSINQAATASAGARGASAGDISQMANSAAAVRQSLVGSFVAQQAGQNAASQNYADTQAHVVAPGQKLGAQAMAQGRVRQAGQKIKDTTAQRGADTLTYRSERKADEAKMVLANQTLGAKVEGAKASAKAAASTKYGTGGSGLNKYGYTYDEWTKLSATQKNKARAGKGKGGGSGDDTVYSDGAFAGKTHAEVNAMTPAQRKALVDAHAKGGTTGGAKGKGPKWVTTEQQNSAMTQAQELKRLAALAKAGRAFVPEHEQPWKDGDGKVHKSPWKKQPLTMEQARSKVMGALGKDTKSPSLVDAAVDAVYQGFLSASTVAALKAAGYKPSVVASNLGVKTSGQVGPKGKDTYGGPH
jgi:hypothetical protein